MLFQHFRCLEWVKYLFRIVGNFDFVPGMLNIQFTLPLKVGVTLCLPLTLLFLMPLVF